MTFCPPTCILFGVVMSFHQDDSHGFMNLVLKRQPRIRAVVPDSQTPIAKKPTTEQMCEDRVQYRLQNLVLLIAQDGKFNIV